MDKKTFNLWNRIVALAVFVVACVTYLSTIEPTASFWDCGEFIASSYKLEVGQTRCSSCLRASSPSPFRPKRRP